MTKYDIYFKILLMIKIEQTQGDSYSDLHGCVKLFLILKSH